MKVARVIASVSLIALAASATPPAAGAAATKRAQLLVAGPVKVKAYKLYLLATPKHPREAANVTVILERGTDNDRQDHYYSFSHGVSVKFAKDGSAARLDGDFGSFGHIHLRFSAGRGGAPLPPFCHGSTVREHDGALAKRHGFDLATHSSYFGDIVENSLPASVVTYVGKTPSCTGKKPTPTKGVTQLSTTASQPGRSLTSFTASRTGSGDIAEDVLLIDSPTSATGPTILHSIDAAALPSRVFTVTGDLSSAHVVGAGSFLSSQFDFTQLSAPQPNFVTGTVTGTLDARFDGIGVVQLQSNLLDATISR
jgi:hypothetical protein